MIAPCIQQYIWKISELNKLVSFISKTFLSFCYFVIPVSCWLLLALSLVNYVCIYNSPLTDYKLMINSPILCSIHVSSIEERFSL